MEIWTIVLFCILLIPLFLAANYLVVRRMAAERRRREDRIERAVSESVARSFTERGERYRSWPRYRARRR
ncbi:MAG: hypothetical protein QUS08_00920 [Methanothrix sp.]|nr:hypothetical protein [Methanothrix sp.]